MNSLTTLLQSVLPVVLSASLSAAALVVVLQTIVWLARFRLPPRWCHALWLVVFVRLALPVLPEVPRSITPPKPTPANVSHYITALQPSADAPDARRPTMDREAVSRAPVPDALLRSADPVVVVSAASPAPPLRSWHWLEIFAVGWVAVAAGMLALMTLAAWKTLRQLRRQSVPAPERVALVFEKLCHDFKLRRRPGLAVCPALAAPVVAGLWRPRILLPTRVAVEFSEEQLRHVLAHEIAHLRRGDLWIHSAVAVLQALHWFNPLVWFAAFRLRAAAEHCCDEWALRRLALTDGRAYADTLLCVLEAPSGTRILPGMAAMAESRTDIRQRIRALGRWGAAPRRWALVSALLLAMVMFCALTVPGAEKQPASEEQSPVLGELVLKVVDADQKPLAGATVRMTNIRVAEAPMDGIGWPELPGLPKEFTTDAEGVARIKYPLETKGSGHLTKVGFGVFAPRHVTLSHHEIALAQDSPPTVQLDTAASLRVRALRGPEGTVVPHFLIQQGTRAGETLWQNEPDGSQLCTEMPPGAARLRAVWQDSATGTTWFSRVTTATLVRATENTLDLTLEPATKLTGAFDDSVPRPVRGGFVSAYFMPAAMGYEQGFIWRSVVPVAPDGTFVFSDCPADAEAYVAGNCEGYFSTDPAATEFYHQPAVHVPAGALGASLVLTMRPSATLEVVVLGPDKKAVEGASVNTSPNTSFGRFSTLFGAQTDSIYKKLASVPCDEQRRILADPATRRFSAMERFNKTTDKEGRVRFTDMPQCSTGVSAYTKELELPPIKQEAFDYWRRWTQVKLEPGQTGSITLELVKVGTTSIPKPAAALAGASTNTTTSARLYSYTPQTAPLVPLNAAMKGEPVAPDEFAGIVLDAKGQPIAGASLRSVALDKWIKTDDNGRFRYRVEAAKGKPTTDLVQVQAKGCSPVTFMEQPTGVYAFITMKGDTSIEGVVKDAAGKPAEGIVIRMKPDNKCCRVAGRSVCERMPYREAKTNAEGHYRLFAESDYYSITVYGRELGTCENKDVWLAQGERKKLDFIADPNAKLEFEMVDAQTQKPVPGAELRCYYFEQEKVWKADDLGHLVIAGLLPGTCEFDPRHTDYARWWCEEAVNPWQRLELADNKKTKWQRNFDDISLDVRKAGKPIKIFMERCVVFRGRVLDPDGKPVAGATVDPAHTGTDNSLTGDTRFSAKTDAEGRYELRIPASNAAQYNLVAHDGKYEEWRKWANGVLPSVRTKPGEVFENVDLTLTRPGVIRGVVLDENGKPVAGQRVYTSPVDRDENRYYNPETKSDKDGRFELAFVRPTKQYLWTSNWLDAPGSVAKEHQIIIDVKAGQTVEFTAPKYER